MVATSPVQAASGQSRFTSGPAIVWYIAGAVLLLELLTANRYGYFGDEREICSAVQPEPFRKSYGRLNRLLKKLDSGIDSDQHDFSHADKSIILSARAGFSPRGICFSKRFQQPLKVMP